MPRGCQRSWWRNRQNTTWHGSFCVWDVLSDHYFRRVTLVVGPYLIAPWLICILYLTRIGYFITVSLFTQWISERSASINDRNHIIASWHQTLCFNRIYWLVVQHSARRGQCFTWLNTVANSCWVQAVFYRPRGGYPGVGWSAWPPGTRGVGTPLFPGSEDPSICAHKNHTRTMRQNKNTWPKTPEAIVDSCPWPMGHF